MVGPAKADVDGSHLWVVSDRWTQTSAILGVAKKAFKTRSETKAPVRLKRWTDFRSTLSCETLKRAMICAKRKSGG